MNVGDTKLGPEVMSALVREAGLRSVCEAGGFVTRTSAVATCLGWVAVAQVVSAALWFGVTWGVSRMRYPPMSAQEVLLRWALGSTVALVATTACLSTWMLFLVCERRRKRA